MNKKTKKGLLKFGKAIWTIYFINTVFPLMAISFYYHWNLPRKICSTKVIESGGLGSINKYLMQTKKPYFLGDWPDISPLEKKTLGWLVHANNITESLIDRGSPPIFADLEKCIELGIGDCVQYSYITYSKFCALSDKLGLPEIKDNVRAVMGRIYTNRIWVGHAWLEVKLKGKWVPYDTTRVLRTKNGTEVQPVVFWDPKVLGDPNLHDRRFLFQIDSRGNMIRDIEVLKGLKDYQGFVGTLINKYRSKRAEMDTGKYQSHINPHHFETSLDNMEYHRRFNSKHRG